MYGHTNIKHKYKVKVAAPYTSGKPCFFQTGMYFTSIKIFNILSKCIAELVKDKN